MQSAKGDIFGQIADWAGPYILPNTQPGSDIPHPMGAAFSVAIGLVGSMLILAVFAIHHRPAWPWRTRIMAVFTFLWFGVFLLSFGFVWWFAFLFALGFSLLYRRYGINMCKMIAISYKDKQPEAAKEHEMALMDFDEDRRKYGRFYAVYLLKQLLNRSSSQSKNPFC